MEPSEPGFKLVLAASGREFWIEDGRTILSVLIEADIDVAYSCEEGICGACEAKVISGTPLHKDTVYTELTHIQKSTMMICVSGCASKELVLDI